MFSIDSRAIPIYKWANPALRIVLIVWRVPSMIHPLRCESNARLPMFLCCRLDRINFFFFFFFCITISVIYFECSKSELDLEESSERLNELRSIFNESSKCQPSVNIFRIQKMLEAISTTSLVELFSKTAPFFK